jgi:LacI family transcriptional regulator
MARSSISVIAETVGVSRNTVSLALRGDPRVAEGTRARVLEAARSLNYRPNLLARAMVTGHSCTVGLVIPRLDYSYMPRLVDAIQEVAFEAGYGVLTCSHHNDADRLPLALAYLHERQVDGVIVHCPVPPSNGAEAAADSPVVNLSFGHARLPGLTLDLLPGAAGEIAVRRLATSGHRRIGYAGERTGFFGAARFDGVSHTAAALGLKPPAAFDGDDSLAGGRVAAAHFLTAHERPTAVVAFTDAVAVGFIQGVTAAGVAVPRDVSVVGVDDLPIAQACTPGLTTLRAPAEEMGRAAMAALTSNRPLPTEGRVFEWQWVERGSTAAA